MVGFHSPLKPTRAKPTHRSSSSRAESGVRPVSDNQRGGSDSAQSFKAANLTHPAAKASLPEKKTRLCCA